MECYYNDGSTVIFKMDNLELLKRMPNESMRLIYCDVLYNSGKDFGDYNDNLGSPEEAVKWYEPRLREMKRVLKADGSIYIHCNWRLDSYLRILMDKIFGPECFKNRIYRQHSDKRGFYTNYDSQVDTILYYVKDPNNFIFNEIRTEVQRIVPLYEQGILKGRDDVRHIGDIAVDLNAQQKHWLISPLQFDKMVQNNEVRIIDGLPYRYSTVEPIGNLWNEPEMLDRYTRIDNSEAYATPKPEAVLERIIRISSYPGDYVADFFMGGGTTAVVCKKLGRKFFGCDISQKACDTTIQKLRSMDITSGGIKL